MLSSTRLTVGHTEVTCSGTLCQEGTVLEALDPTESSPTARATRYTLLACCRLRCGQEQGAAASIDWKGCGSVLWCRGSRGLRLAGWFFMAESWRRCGHRSQRTAAITGSSRSPKHSVVSQHSGQAVARRNSRTEVKRISKLIVAVLLLAPTACAAEQANGGWMHRVLKVKPQESRQYHVLSSIMTDIKRDAPGASS